MTSGGADLAGWHLGHPGRRPGVVGMNLLWLIRFGALCGAVLGLSLGVPGLVEAFTGETTVTSFIVVAGLFSANPGLWFLGGIAALAGLEVLEAFGFRGGMSRWVAAGLLAARTALFVVVAVADDSGVARAMFVLIPFGAYFVFGAAVSIALGAALLAFASLGQNLPDTMMYGRREGVGAAGAGGRAAVGAGARCQAVPVRAGAGTARRRCGTGPRQRGRDRFRPERPERALPGGAGGDHQRAQALRSHRDRRECRVRTVAGAAGGQRQRASLLSLQDGMEVVGTAADGREAAARATFDDERYVVDALRAGASGYLLKDLPSKQPAAAIRMTHAGVAQLDPAAAARLAAASSRPASPALSEREVEVLRLVAAGLTNREIGQRLYLSEGTVNNHVSKVLERLGLREGTQAALYARDHGLI